MKITVLVDNFVLHTKPFIGEHGFSCYLEAGKKKILFDVGYSDALLVNAQKLHINICDLDYIVISHGHLDHTWGLSHIITLYSQTKLLDQSCTKPTIIGCPEIFDTRSFQSLSEVGSLLPSDKLICHFNINLSPKPVWLTDDLVFLGRIPRVFDFEEMSPMGEIACNGDYKPDYLQDDSALAYKSKDGLVIITGCSHSGICNIVEYARKICKTDKVLDIIGGLHLFGPLNEKIEKTMGYIKSLGLRTLYPCHCTDLECKMALAKVASVKESGVGLCLSY